jgi:hypothetical protein
MPVKPKIVTLTNSSVDVLNAIRNSATINFQNYVPVATSDPESVRTIGAIICDNPQLQNEFLNALVNRIGRVIYTSKSYQNPWAVLKRGMMEFGETEEEIFINLCKVENYDPSDAETTLFKRNVPDVRTTFRVINYKKLYPMTIQNDDLRTAFLSWDGVTSLISKLVESIYTSAEYDEFLVMKYLLAQHILAGHLTPIQIAAVSSDNAKEIVTKIKQISNGFRFMSAKYNMAAVPQLSRPDEQYIIVNTDFDASMDVNVLASAFNMDKAEFVGRRILVDSFGELDTARLGEIFEGDPTYEEISADDLAKLDTVPAVLIDRDFLAIYDNLIQFTEQYNGKGLYWNYFLHLWKTFSISPFANSAVFTPTAPGVTAVTVTPSAVADPAAGTEFGLTPNVTTTGFAPTTVDYVSSSAKVTVNKAGRVKVITKLAVKETVTITVKSTFDPSKTATCTISGPNA